VRESPQDSVQRREQRRVADPRDLLAATDCVSDPRAGAEDPVDRGVDVAVTGVPGDGAGLAGQRQRGALGDDRAEGVLAGLDHNVGMEPGDERGTHRDGEVGGRELDLGRGALPHPRVYEHTVAKAGQQWPKRADVDRDRFAPLQSAGDLPQGVDEHRLYAGELRPSVEGCVGECHPAPGRRGPRVVMDHHAVAFAEQ
jgi:hypothetical protein